MIELTNGYINGSSKILINPDHIICVRASVYKNASYEGVQSYIEYYGGQEKQVLYCKESYEQIKEMLNDSISFAATMGSHDYRLAR